MNLCDFAALLFIGFAAFAPQYSDEPEYAMMFSLVMAIYFAIGSVNTEIRELQKLGKELAK